MDVFRQGVAACYQMIMQESQCSKDYFTYVERGDKNRGCKTPGALRIRSNSKADCYSVITQPPCSFKKMYFPLDINGQRRTVASPKKCQKHCRDTPGCKYFQSWPNLGCHITTGVDGWKSAESSIKSGSSTCALSVSSIDPV